MLSTILLSLITACNDVEEKETNTEVAPKAVEAPTPKGESGITMLTSSTSQVASWNGGTFKYSNGTEVSGTGYDAANTWSATPMNYDWAIGGNHIQSN